MKIEIVCHTPISFYFSFFFLFNLVFWFFFIFIYFFFFVVDSQKPYPRFNLLFSDHYKDLNAVKDFTQQYKKNSNERSLNVKNSILYCV
jgi:hypothetical protein